MSRHVVYVVERRAWCSYCDWEVRTYNAADVETAADWHAYVTSGSIKPGWDIDKTAERARVAAEIKRAGGRIKTGRHGASTPAAALTPSSNRPNDGSEVLTS